MSDADAALVGLVESRQRFFKGLSAAPNSVYGDVAGLWEEFFDNRGNFPDADTFTQFRSPQTAESLGMGDHPVIDRQAEVFFQAVQEVADSYSFPVELLDVHPEPALGKPLQLEHMGRVTSANYLKQLVSVWHMQRFLEPILAQGKPLRICEIGAGFGLTVYLAHRLFDVESYTVIDLPENLYLSSLYAPLLLPEKSHAMFDGKGDLSPADESQLNFVMAPFTDAVSGPFDLVINAASLAEMPFETSEAYLSWIRRNLGSDGVFCSINRLNVRGHEETLKHSDFSFLDFEVRHIDWAHGPLRPTNQNALILVMGALGDRSQTIRTEHFDALTQLITVGGTEELNGLCQAIVAGRLTTDEAQFLEFAWAFFTEGDASAKGKMLDDALFEPWPQLKLALSIMVLSVVGQFGAILELKQAVIQQQFGPKLATCLLGHIAEIEVLNRLPQWTETIAILKEVAPSQAAFLEMQFERGIAASSFQTKFAPLVFPLLARQF